MSTTRRRISSNIAARDEIKFKSDFIEQNPADYYGEKVFGDSEMKKRLPKSIYKALKKTIQDRAPLDASIADSVAYAMKDWALEHGVTHYTHWFQPLTGTTAEKHDAFINPDGDGKILMEFSGKTLIKGEPDASSFPSGGIRATFEARGYTAWDPTSPAFIRETTQGGTLCIPTAFGSYTGEALDMKTPLLRSQEALSKSAVKLLTVLGEEVTRVTTNAGLEQEYFLIDKEYFNHRPDMVATGRTLFGNAPYKGQELDDHYFGAIKKRVLNFMQETERELYKLGIPIKTRHNEVAPSQFEVAPVFEDANLATDHNLVVMEVMQEVAARHGLKMLLHEKPFAGINGSGKHCNWSMATIDGDNLLEPGDTPHKNLRFMVILSAILRAVDTRAKLLRHSIASAGNDHRLGANEAPPAILSAFIGDDLETIVNNIIAGDRMSGSSDEHLNLGVSTLPPLPMDNTDRNRTSPFAFTGNKFEFRALGSAQNTSLPNFILNTAVAESLDYVSGELESKIAAGSSIQEAAKAVIKQVLTDHQRIIFNGDGYSQEWQDEAAKRGLPNLRSTVEASMIYTEQETKDLYEKYGVLTAKEVDARFNIRMEKYITNIMIEARATKDIAETVILPAAITYQSKLALAVKDTVAVLGDEAVPAQMEELKALTENIQSLLISVNELEAKINEEEDEDIVKHGEFIRDVIIPHMNKVREIADVAETLVDDSLWPLPKYREILFIS